MKKLQEKLLSGHLRVLHESCVSDSLGTEEQVKKGQVLQTQQPEK